jgi:hypothetical protein
MRLCLRGVPLLWLLGCTEPAWAPPEPVPVALLTPDVWSGGEAVLASAAFTPDRGLPVVLLNDDTLVVRRLDDTTVAARLPDLPGTQVLHVLTQDVLDFPIVVELRGFESAGSGPILSGRLQVLAGVRPTVVGTGVTGAVVWNLQTTIGTPLPDSLHDPMCAGGVGPSYAGITLVPSCQYADRWWSWRLRPTVELVDDSLCGGWYNAFAVELGHGRGLALGTDEVWLSYRDGLTCSRSHLVWAGASDVVISPRGDRAAIIAQGYGSRHYLDTANAPLGMPVIDVEGGRIAYEVGSLHGPSGAAFSNEGDTLFVVGRDASGRQEVLLALRAADGQLLRSLVVPLKSWAIAVDPVRPWVYVGGYTLPEGRTQLLVFDRKSLALLASVGAPDSVSGFTCCDFGTRIVPSPAEQRVYVVWAPHYRVEAAPAFLTRFRTPP